MSMTTTGSGVTELPGHRRADAAVAADDEVIRSALTASSIRRCSLRPLAASLMIVSATIPIVPKMIPTPATARIIVQRARRVQLVDLAEPDGRQRDDRHVGRVVDGPALDDEAEPPDAPRRRRREPDPDVARADNVPRGRSAARRAVLLVTRGA